MTQSFENNNRSDLPEWMEPFAVVDYHVVAIGLWRWTNWPLHLQLAKHVCHNVLTFDNVPIKVSTRLFASPSSNPVLRHIPKKRIGARTIPRRKGLSCVAQFLF